MGSPALGQVPGEGEEAGIVHDESAVGKDVSPNEHIHTKGTGIKVGTLKVWAKRC